MMGGATFTGGTQSPEIWNKSLILALFFFPRMPVISATADRSLPVA
jgi:hypothetical protein